MIYGDASSFCNWLNDREKFFQAYDDEGALLPLPGPRYRLPTEAEWEFACRAGSDTLWSFGNDVKLLGDFAWFLAESPPKVTPPPKVAPAPPKITPGKGEPGKPGSKKKSGPEKVRKPEPEKPDPVPAVPGVVAQKKPNAFGLYDVHGNVWEICQDFFDPKYYEQSPSEDPQGASKMPGHVSRGGACDRDASWCRSSMRFKTQKRPNMNGFRIIKELPRGQ
jgi:formylglycine-generating enzyme required for sulfatase activity